jgi:hypothetical protein
MRWRASAQIATTAALEPRRGIEDRLRVAAGKSRGVESRFAAASARAGLATGGAAGTRVASVEAARARSTPCEPACTALAARP